jgi:hypothetical protein
MDAVNPPVRPPALAEDNASQLRLLAIFHYVVAAITGLFSLFPVLHLVMGLAMVNGRPTRATRPSPRRCSAGSS